MIMEEDQEENQINEAPSLYNSNHRNNETNSTYSLKANNKNQKIVNQQKDLNSKKQYQNINQYLTKKSNYQNQGNNTIKTITDRPNDNLKFRQLKPEYKIEAKSDELKNLNSENINSVNEQKRNKNIMEINNRQNIKGNYNQKPLNYNYNISLIENQTDNPIIQGESVYNQTFKMTSNTNNNSNNNPLTINESESSLSGRFISRKKLEIMKMRSFEPNDQIQYSISNEPIEERVIFRKKYNTNESGINNVEEKGMKLLLNDFVSHQNSLNDAGIRSNFNGKEQEYIPLALAKDYIQKMEDDIRKMYNRHMNLVKELEMNYKVIEDETEQHYMEFLDKWKKIAQSKILSFRNAYELMKLEKEELEEKYLRTIEELNNKNETRIREYNILLRKYQEDVDIIKKEAEFKVSNIEFKNDYDRESMQEKIKKMENIISDVTNQNDYLLSNYNKIINQVNSKISSKNTQLNSLLENYAKDVAACTMNDIISQVEKMYFLNTVTQCEEQTKKLKKEKILLTDELDKLKEDLHEIELKQNKEKEMDKRGIELNKLKFKDLYNKSNLLRTQIQSYVSQFERLNNRKIQRFEKEPIRKMFKEYHENHSELRKLHRIIQDQEHNDSLDLIDEFAFNQNNKEDNNVIFNLKEENCNLKAELQRLKNEIMNALSDKNVIAHLRRLIEEDNKKNELGVEKKLNLNSNFNFNLNNESDNELGNLKNSNNALRLKISELLSNPEEHFKVEYSKILEENELLNNQIRELENAKIELNEAFTKISSLKRDIELFNNENINLRTNLLEINEKAKHNLINPINSINSINGINYLSIENLKNLKNENPNSNLNLNENRNLNIYENENENLSKENILVLEKQKELARKNNEEINQKIKEMIANSLQFNTGQININPQIDNLCKELEASRLNNVKLEQELFKLRNEILISAQGKQDVTSIFQNQYDKIITENGEKNSKIKELENRCQRLSQQFSEAESYKILSEQLKVKCHQFQLQLDNINIEGAKVNTQKNKIKQVNKSLYKDKDKTQKQKDQKDPELIGIEFLQEELEKMLNENIKLSSQVKDSIELLEKLKNKEKLLYEAQIQLEKYQDELGMLNAQKEMMKPKAEKVNAFKAEINELRARLAKMSKFPNPTIADSEQIMILKKEMNKILEDNKSLASKVDEAEKIKINFLNFLNSKSKLAELEAKLKKAEQKLKDRNPTIITLSEAQKYRDDLEKIKKEKYEWEKLNRENQNSIKKLKNEEEHSRSKFEQVQKEMMNLKEKYDKLDKLRKVDLGKLDNNKNKNIDSTKKNEEIIRLNKQIETLSSEIEKLRDEKNNSDSLRQKAISDLVEAENRYKSVSISSNEALQIKEELRRKNLEIVELKKALSIMEEKYKKEVLERKRLYNLLQDLKGKIRVYCRVRPLKENELKMHCKEIYKIEDEYTIVISSKSGPKTFSFDTIFGPTATNEQVFEDTRKLMQSAIDGYNICIFAYGQTGSGKTYTIHGEKGNPGIAARAINELFLIINSMHGYNVNISCYMVELYIDTLYDLLLAKTQSKNPPKLDIKDDIHGLIYVQGATVRSIASFTEAQKIFEEGFKMRQTGKTLMNENSSRSHLIFSMTIETFNQHSKVRTTSKLSFVDLAGSERVNKAGVQDETQFKQLRTINKSLTSLGDVISCLSENKPSSFVPYRNNKLTMLMRDSIGGNSKTLMFVNISPADYNLDESISSLIYASRTKMITNELKKNVDNLEMKKLNEKYKKLVIRVDDLKHKLIEKGVDPKSLDNPNDPITELTQNYPNDNKDQSNSDIFNKKGNENVNEFVNEYENENENEN